MNRNRPYRPYIGPAVLLTLAWALAYLGWRMLGPGETKTCHACGRPAHEQALTIGLDDGHQETYCCLACALTHHHQSGTAVEVVELRDYPTGQPISPEQAYIVGESDVNLCMRQAVLADREGASTVEFDRCAPSMLAFTTRQRAEAFQQRHGGILLLFSQVYRAFETP